MFLLFDNHIGNVLSGGFFVSGLTDGSWFEISFSSCLCISFVFMYWSVYFYGAIIRYSQEWTFVIIIFPFYIDYLQWCICRWCICLSFVVLFVYIQPPVVFQPKRWSWAQYWFNTEIIWSYCFFVDGWQKSICAYLLHRPTAMTISD